MYKGGSQTRVTESARMDIRQEILDLQSWQLDRRYWMYKGGSQTESTGCTRGGGAG